MSHTAAAEYEILGFSLFGPPPVGSVYFPWDPGLTVLYGANGAGKTSILRGLESATTGVAIPDATSMMHIGAHPRFAPRPPRSRDQVLRGHDDGNGMTPKPSGLVATILDAIYHEVLENVHSYPGRGDYAFDTDPERVFEYQDRLGGDPVDIVSVLVEAFCGNLPSATEIAVEVSQQMCFTLIAAGTTERPTWNVNVSVARSSETPAVNALALKLIERPMASLGEIDGVFFDWMVHSRLHSLNLLRQENAPMPIVQAGTVQVLQTGLVRVDELRESAIDRPRLITELDDLDVGIATAHALDASPTGLFATSDDSGWALTVNDEIPEILGEIERAVNQILSRLLLDAPELSVSIADPPIEWLSKPVITWQAHDRYTDNWVLISQLSEAQRRWAEMAVQVALVARFDADRPAVVILDEPEQALHRLAVKQAVDGLVALGEAGIGPVIVASHSAEFLNARGARLVWVKRLPDGSADARVMDPETGDSAFRALESTGGLADLLLGTRVWLIVEGQHDKVVVESLIGDALERSRTRVIAIGGTPNLSSVIDSQLLFDFTDVMTVIALDRTSHPRLFQLWDTTQKMSKSGNYGKARHHAENANTKGFTKEEMVAYRFLKQAIHSKRLERVHLFGFEKPDILYYLPVEEFVDENVTWEELSGERRPGENVKAVIKRRSKRPVNVGRVKKAAGTMDEIPREFNDLLNVCGSVPGTADE